MTADMRAPFDVKAVEEDGYFCGYASVFGLRDRQGDSVQPGAFSRAVAEVKSSGRYPRLLWQHRPEQPVGRIISLKEDAYGLWVEGQLSLELQCGREAYAMLKGDIIDSLSIGYEVIEAGVDAQHKTRLLKQLRLWEISLVTFPANTAARVNMVKTADPWGLVREAVRKAVAIIRPLPQPA